MKARSVGIALLPACDALGCDALADWQYQTNGQGEMYLCAFHGGKEPVEGWEWIGE